MKLKKILDLFLLTLVQGDLIEDVRVVPFVLDVRVVKETPVHAALISAHISVALSLDSVVDVSHYFCLSDLICKLNNYIIILAIISRENNNNFKTKDSNNGLEIRRGKGD